MPLSQVTRTRAERLAALGRGVCLATLTIMAVAHAAQADIIRSFSAPPGLSAPSVEPRLFGQSLVTPHGGPWNNLEFNFYAADESPVALGTLFLLSAEFVHTNGTFAGFLHGEPNANFVPPVIARAVGNGSTYVFDPSVTLAPHTPYWFYVGPNVILEDASIYEFVAVAGLTLQLADPAELAYITGPAGKYESLLPGARLHYLLQGDVVISQVSEPGSLALLIMGAVGLGLRRAARRQTAVGTIDRERREVLPGGVRSALERGELRPGDCGACAGIGELGWGIGVRVEFCPS